MTASQTTGRRASGRPGEPLSRNAVGRGTTARGPWRRALAIEPAALLLDEPFSALDTHLRGALERQLRETLGSYQGSTIFVSHNS